MVQGLKGWAFLLHRFGVTIDVLSSVLPTRSYRPMHWISVCVGSLISLLFCLGPAGKYTRLWSWRPLVQPRSRQPLATSRTRSPRPAPDKCGMFYPQLTAQMVLPGRARREGCNARCVRNGEDDLLDRGRTHHVAGLWLRDPRRSKSQVPGTGLCLRVRPAGEHLLSPFPPRPSATQVAFAFAVAHA
eukprot:503829-Rhodomonas_salina.2